MESIVAFRAPTLNSQLTTLNFSEEQLSSSRHQPLPFGGMCFCTSLRKRGALESALSCRQGRGIISRYRFLRSRLEFLSDIVGRSPRRTPSHVDWRFTEAPCKFIF